MEYYCFYKSKRSKDFTFAREFKACTSSIDRLFRSAVRMFEEGNEHFYIFLIQTDTPDVTVSPETEIAWARVKPATVPIQLIAEMRPSAAEALLLKTEARMTDNALLKYRNGQRRSAREWEDENPQPDADKIE